jgi:hypothetical protein
MEVARRVPHYLRRGTIVKRGADRSQRPLLVNFGKLSCHSASAVIPSVHDEMRCTRHASLRGAGEASNNHPWLPGPLLSNAHEKGPGGEVTGLVGKTIGSAVDWEQATEL